MKHLVVVLLSALLLVPLAAAQTTTPERWQPALLTINAGLTFVNFRDWPDVVNSTVLQKITSRTVEVSSQQEVIGWWRLRVDGQIGWVSETVAQVTALVTATPSRTATPTATTPATATGTLPPPPVLITPTRESTDALGAALMLLEEAEVLERRAQQLRSQARALLEQVR